LYCSVPLRSWSLLFTNRVVSNLFVLLCSVCALNHHWFAMNLLLQPTVRAFLAVKGWVPGTFFLS
jgi:hypothetical protein